MGEVVRVPVSGAEIEAERLGAGPPVLLLHGYPQTRRCWSRVAERLAERHLVVAADLRGYGGSSAPPSDPGHTAYAKRAMARDMLEVMAALGHERFAVVGHDRGARVAYRLALDAPAAVDRLAVLDVVPTAELWRAMDADLALGTYHWLFLAQPDGLPETLLRGHEEEFVRETLRRWAGRPDALDAVFDAEAIAEYVRRFRPHETCEDYRAGATVDRAHDEEDLAAGRRIGCPVLVLWGRSFNAQAGDPLQVWARWARDVRGRGLACGHFLPEEAPDEVAQELLAFLAPGG